MWNFGNFVLVGTFGHYPPLAFPLAVMGIFKVLKRIILFIMRRPYIGSRPCGLWLELFLGSQKQKKKIHELPSEEVRTVWP